MNTRHLRQHLSSTKISSLPLKPASKIIQICSDETPTEAFLKLTSNGILGAPVKDVNSGKYIGFLDVRELVKFACVQKDTDPSTPPVVNNMSERTRFRLGKLLGYSAVFTCIKPGHTTEMDDVTVSQLARMRRFCPLSPEATLLDAAQILGSSRGTHRVAIVKDPENPTEIVTILSQSDLLRWLSTLEVQEEISSPTMNVGSVLEGGCGVKDGLVCVKGTDSARHMFEIMSAKGLSGAPVVNEEGHFEGAMSSTDLKLWLHGCELTMLHETVDDFMAAVRQSQVSSLHGKTRFPVVSVSEQDAFSHVIGLLAKTGLHRVYVRDEQHKPTGVITITDILKLVVQE